MPGFRGLAAGPGSPPVVPPTPPARRVCRESCKGVGSLHLNTSGVEDSAALPVGLWGPQTASLPARPPAPQVRGCREHPPGLGLCPPGGGRRPAPPEQCGRLFCRLSASFPDPPFHAPWPNRHRPGTQREEPPYLVLERRGKGYPQMPAALGHLPAPGRSAVCRR